MLCISFVMTGIIGRTVFRMNTEQAENLIIALTEKKANAVEKEMMENVSSVEAISGMLGGSWAIPDELRRTACEQEIRSMVNNTSVKSVWAIWLPGRFDRRDSFDVDEASNPTGQFRVHYITDVDGREPFRKISYIRSACQKTISGHGTDGYLEAMDFLTGGCGDADNA